MKRAAPNQEIREQKEKGKPFFHLLFFN